MAYVIGFNIKLNIPTIFSPFVGIHPGFGCSEPSKSCIEPVGLKILEGSFSGYKQTTRMKYQWGSWKGKANRHQLLVDNSNPTKTARLNGYGMGVTFTARCFIWDKNFTSSVEAMRFYEPLSSHGF